jgi:DNA polymerase-1
VPTYIGLDTETYLIQPGLQAPPLVVMSMVGDLELGAALLLRDEALATVRNLLTNPDMHLVLQNAAFDMAVFAQEDATLLPLIQEAYAAGRIHCTRIREMLLHNATDGLNDGESGPRVGFSLADIVRRRFGVDLSADKSAPDAWRLRYGELDGVPLSEWPTEAKRYAGDDAVWALRIWREQETQREYLEDAPGQTRAAWCLHLMQAWGMLTEEAAVLELEERLAKRVEEANEKLLAAGLLKGKTKRDKATGIIEVEWSKNAARIKELVEAGFAAQDAEVPRTEPSDRFPEGQIKTDEETLRAARVPELVTLADSLGDAKLLSTYVQALKGKVKKGNTDQYEQRGRHIPGKGWLINASWNPLVASGRTSCQKPNLQNPPRKGGVRECFVPREGHWFLSVDYSFIELCTWAQACLDIVGKSDMAEAIRQGLDPHVDMGVEILRAEGRDVDYAACVAARKAGEAWAKDARQLAKAANFGLPGGLGAATFVAYAHATYGVELTEQQARDLKTVWRAKWSEADAYFAHVSGLQGFGGTNFRVTLPRSGFVRAGCTFTSGCNTYFQGTAARGAKEALWLLTRACYGDDPVLAGCRPVAFIHDEFILEVPAHPERAHLASERVQELMIEGMKRFVPDVPIKAEPTLMARWYKEAEPVWANGMLALWTPKEK